MSITPAQLPTIIEAVAATIERNADAVTELDQAIGDGDHVTNLQRGIDAVRAKADELARLDWPAALQNIGMTLLSTMGGASGSLFGTFFLDMSKAAREHSMDWPDFAAIFTRGVEAVKRRGKAEAGEKTMLDVLIPVSETLQQAAATATPPPDLLETVCQVATAGMESTRDMVATKGRASFLEERTRGHIDAGAKTSQLIICAVVDVLRTIDSE